MPVRRFRIRRKEVDAVLKYAAAKPKGEPFRVAAGDLPKVPWARRLQLRVAVGAHGRKLLEGLEGAWGGCPCARGGSRRLLPPPGGFRRAREPSRRLEKGSQVLEGEGT